MATANTQLKKRNNYKLLVDPEIKKGQKKVYRLNGKDVLGFPPCGEIKDPRTQKTVLGLGGSAVEYKLPRFKFDQFWEGDPPERDVFVIGLNESVRGSLFKEVCTGFGSVFSMKFHRHPKSKTFLGAATVSFVHSGVGRKAMKELDGKVIGGCYLRAELDDNGDHLKKYLEPVLKKCGLDKKALVRQLGKGSVSDSEETRTRTSSTTESVPDTNDGGEMEIAQHITSAATTPITPNVKTDPLPNTSFPSLFQYSILNVGTSEGGGGGFGSPGFTTPCTPSSMDSGISVRTHTTALPSPTTDPRTRRPPFCGLSTTLPPLPPEESAPPLPPQDTEAPPPLPPLPPALGEDGGIENISSDEEDSKNKPGSSPVFLSPTSSPHMTTPTPNHTFDPSLGLKSLLATTADKESTKSSKAPYVGSSSPRPPYVGSSSPGPPYVGSSSPIHPYVGSSSPGAPYVGSSSPRPPYVGSSSPRPAYELEVEEISGDESPVMVYFEPLKVESISDDDGEGGGGEGGGGANGGGGGDDMEISDNENDQDNVIEVNVKPVRFFHPHHHHHPMMGPHPPHHMPHPHFHPGPPPPGFFPPHLPPPHGIFHPMHPHFMMFPPSRSPPPLPRGA